MGISGTQLAPTQARWNVMRFGASRFGDFYPTLIVSLGGTNLARLVRLETLVITDRLNEEPNDARFILRQGSITPVEGQAVIIALGTSTDYTRLFAGSIIRVTQIQPKISQEISYDIEAMDYTWLLDRRFVTKQYQHLSASAIARDVIDTFTTGGFTGNHIEGGLEELEDFRVTNERPSTVLTKLANNIGAQWYIDPFRDLHFFTTDVDQEDPPDLDSSNTKYWGFHVDRDMSQVRTRAIVEGRSTQTAADVDAADTIIAVEDASLFDSAGGEARIACDLITYTGTVDGGTGSLVGPGVAPPTAPSGSGTDGTGIDDGFHYWAYTWVTASGETLPSPTISGATGHLAAPTTAPTRAASAGTGLNAGTYTYAVNFVVGANETPNGPTGTVVTTDGIDDPTTNPSASASWFPGEAHTGGRYAIGDSVYCRCSFVDGSGNETGGTDSNTVTVASFGGSPGSVLFYNLPTPGAGVVLKRLYLNVNGSFVAYKNLSTGAYSDSWYDAGTAGSFPIGGSPDLKRVTLTNIPTGLAGAVTARRVYRTVVGGSALLLVATIADNTTTTYIDSTADGSLGAAAPTTNTTTINELTFTSIPIGPAGVTSRKVYRSAAGSVQLQLLTTLADNTTTTYTDNTADSALGANAPTSDTSALTQVTGQVNAGATTLLVAGPGAFSAGGGWALVGEQVIRYTGISGQSLTGIPESGTGALNATVSYGATIVEAPRLTGVSGLTQDVPRGEAVVLRVTRDDTTAQATLAAIEGGDGIHEHLVSDGHLSLEQATARGDAELETFGSVVRSVSYQTRHPNAASGRTVTVDLAVPIGVSEAFTIRSVTIGGFADMTSRLAHAVTKFPIRQVDASPVRLGSYMDNVTRGEDSF